MGLWCIKYFELAILSDLRFKWGVKSAAGANLADSSLSLVILPFLISLSSTLNEDGGCIRPS